MEHRKISSGSPFEKPIGFSRALRTGNRILVSGTAPIAEDGSAAFPGDVYRQTRHCLQIIEKAITTAGGQLEDVYTLPMEIHGRKQVKHMVNFSERSVLPPPSLRFPA